MGTCNNVMLLISVFIVCQKMQITALSLVDHQTTGSPKLPRSVSSSKEMKTIKGSNPKYVVCYFTSWSGGRSDKGKFTPEDIVPSLCTHINYAFASLNNKTLTIVPNSPYFDSDQKFYERIINLKKKNKRLKVLLALGGWSDSKGDKYSRMISDSSSRKNFIKEAVFFLKKHQFDGLDFDWEYPVCWQGNCSAGNPKDKELFSLFIKELRTDFQKSSPPLLLTVALTASKYYAEKAYAVAELAEYLDYLNIMAYDLHGSYEDHTGHHSQFFPWRGATSDHLNVVSSMEYYVQEGAPREKLILGIPLYGRSFTLEDPLNNGISAPAIGPGVPGLYTKSAGILSYFEICDRIKNHNWTVQRDPEAGPYAFHGDQWVGYDDPVSAKEKSSFVLEKGYGGVMVWELSLDDFRGECDTNKFPIVRTLQMFMQENASDEGATTDERVTTEPADTCVSKEKAQVETTQDPHYSSSDCNNGNGSSSPFDTSMSTLIWTVAFLLLQERKNFLNFN